MEACSTGPLNHWGSWYLTLPICVSKQINLRSIPLEWPLKKNYKAIGKYALNIPFIWLWRRVQSMCYIITFFFFHFLGNFDEILFKIKYISSKKASFKPLFHYQEHWGFLDKLWEVFLPDLKNTLMSSIFEEMRIS